MIKGSDLLVAALASKFRVLGEGHCLGPRRSFPWLLSVAG
jgi:hypothetical protein